MRVPAVTGMFNPVVNPLLTSPILTTPVKVGPSVTEAPGIGAKVSSGVEEEYN